MGMDPVILEACARATHEIMTRRAARTALDRPALVAYPLPRRPHRAVRGALLALAVGLVTWGALALAWETVGVVL